MAQGFGMFAVTSNRLLQAANAEAPMVVTEAGIFIESNS